MVDDKLVIDEAMYELLETSKLLTDEDLTYKADPWSESWVAGMKDDSVFGYFRPTWGLHYVLKPNT